MRSRTVTAEGWIVRLVLTTLTLASGFTAYQAGVNGQSWLGSNPYPPALVTLLFALMAESAWRNN